MFLMWISGILRSGIVIRIIEKMERSANTIERMFRNRAASEDFGSSTSLQTMGLNFIQKVILPRILVTVVKTTKQRKNGCMILQRTARKNKTRNREHRLTEQ